MERVAIMGSIMTVRAPEDLQDILSAQAKSLGLARNALVLQILWDWVENHPQGAAAQKAFPAAEIPPEDVRIST